MSRQKTTDWSDEKITAAIDVIVSPYGLKAEVLPDILSVGVQGDERTYLPVVILTGPHPGYEVLSRLSLDITNSVPINRVMFESARKP